MLDDREERMFTRMINFTEANRGPNITDITVDQPVETRQRFQFSQFHWGGKLRMCPENFEFPLSDVKTMFNLWHFGNSAMKIQPYKHFDRFRDDLRIKKHKNNFGRAKLVMEKLDKIFLENQMFGDHNNISQIDSIAVLNSSFAIAYEKLIEICYDGQSPPQKRPNDIQLNTFASRIRKLPH